MRAVGIAFKGGRVARIRNRATARFERGPYRPLECGLGMTNEGETDEGKEKALPTKFLEEPKKESMQSA